MDFARSSPNRYVEDADTLRRMELRRGSEEGDAGKGCLGRPDEEILLLLCGATRVDKEGILEEAGRFLKGVVMS